MNPESTCADLSSGVVALDTSYNDCHKRKTKKLSQKLRRDLEPLWDGFIQCSISSDLVLMKQILTAFHWRSQNDGEALLLSVFDALNRDDQELTQLRQNLMANLKCLWAVFNSSSLTCDLMLMKQILAAFHRHWQNDGGVLLLAIFDTLDVK